MENKSELTLLETILFLIALFMIQSIMVFVFTLIYGIIFHVVNPGIDFVTLMSVLNSSSLLNVINFVFVELSFFFFALILGYRYKTNFKSLIGIEKLNIFLVLFIFLFSLSFLVVSSELENIFAGIFCRIFIMGDFITRISKGAGIVGFIIALFVIDIVPAISEETLFRGLFLENLTRKYGFLKALVVISILFALLHINPSVIISVFLLGMILGYIYLKTRNLIYPVILHFLNNMFATLLLRTKVIKIKGLTPGAETVEHVSITIFILSIMLSILFFLIIRKIVERKET